MSPYLDSSIFIIVESSLWFQQLSTMTIFNCNISFQLKAVHLLSMSMYSRPSLPHGSSPRSDKYISNLLAFHRKMYGFCRFSLAKIITIISLVSEIDSFSHICNNNPPLNYRKTRVSMFQRDFYATLLISTDVVCFDIYPAWGWIVDKWYNDEKSTAKRIGYHKI